RHTRSYGDWSSDVCSSDLTPSHKPVIADGCRCGTTRGFRRIAHSARMTARKLSALTAKQPPSPSGLAMSNAARDGPTSRVTLNKIGRASCRERGEEQEGDG